MRRFNFHVRAVGANAEEARQKLNVAGMPTLGPAFTYFIHAPPESEGRFGDTVVAYLNADDEEAALGRVRDTVGEDFELEVKPFGEDFAN